jgi:hypothetical protein
LGPHFSVGLIALFPFKCSVLGRKLHHHVKVTEQDVVQTSRESGGATETDNKLWNGTTVEVAEPQKQTISCGTGQTWKWRSHRNRQEAVEQDNRGSGGATETDKAVERTSRGSGGATETDKKLWNRTTVEVAEPQKQTISCGTGQPWKWRSHRNRQ